MVLYIDGQSKSERVMLEALRTSLTSAHIDPGFVGPPPIFLLPASWGVNALSMF